MVSNQMMDVKENDGTIKYSYKIVSGISRVQGAIQIFKEMKYPNEIIDCYKSM